MGRVGRPAGAERTLKDAGDGEDARERMQEGGAVLCSGVQAAHSTLARKKPENPYRNSFSSCLPFPAGTFHGQTQVEASGPEGTPSVCPQSRQRVGTGARCTWGRQCREAGSRSVLQGGALSGDRFSYKREELGQELGEAEHGRQVLVLFSRSLMLWIQ